MRDDLVPAAGADGLVSFPKELAERSDAIAEHRELAEGIAGELFERLLKQNLGPGKLVNYLGYDSRNRGQSLVPAPPHRIKGQISVTRPSDPRNRYFVLLTIAEVAVNGLPRLGERRVKPDSLSGCA